MNVRIATTAGRVLFAVVVVTGGLLALVAAARAVTTAETSGPTQIVPDSEQTQPTVHTVNFTQTVIIVKNDGITTTSIPTNTVVDLGTLVVGDLIIDPPLLTLQNWSTAVDPLVLFPTEQEPIEVGRCDGTDYFGNTKTLTVDLASYKTATSAKLDLLKKPLCHPDVFTVITQSDGCEEMRVRQYEDSGGIPNLASALVLDIGCESTRTPTSGGPPPTPTWTSNGSTPTATWTPRIVRVAVYPSGGDKVSVQLIDSVDPNLENTLQISETAIQDVIEAFDSFILAIVGLFDIDAPHLAVTPDQTIEAVGPDGAPVFFHASSRDVNGLFTGEPVDPAPLVECRDQTNAVRLSGHTFGVGQWTVTCRSWDHKWDLILNDFILGNQAVPKSFTVEVVPKQTSAQDGCINALSKAAAKVGRAQGKENVACVKLGRQEPVDPMCPSADLKQKVSTKVAKTLAEDAKKCVPAPPDFAYTSGGVASSSYQQAELELLADVFGGTDLSATISTDDAIGGCQLAAIKNVERLSAAAARAFVKCTKAALKRTRVTLAGLGACAGDDADAQVAKAADRLAEDIADACNGVAVGAAFPGVCAGASVDTLPACLAARARCRMCLAANAAAFLAAPCDTIDDGAANSSCTP